MLFFSQSACVFSQNVWLLVDKVGFLLSKCMVLGLTCRFSHKPRMFVFLSQCVWFMVEHIGIRTCLVFG